MALQKASVRRVAGPLRRLLITCSVGILHGWPCAQQPSKPRSLTPVFTRTPRAFEASEESLSLISFCRCASSYCLFPIFFNPFKTIP